MSTVHNYLATSRLHRPLISVPIALKRPFLYSMRHIAAYALLLVGGNAAPTAEQVSALVVAAGGESDEAQVAALFANLEGKDIHELLAKGEIDLKAVTSGGGGGAAAAPAAAGAAAAPVAAKVAAPVEEEVDALDGGMDMFGGGGAKTGDY